MRTSKKLLAVLLTIATIIGIFSCATTVFAEEYNEYTDNKSYQENLLTEAVENESEQAEIVCGSTQGTVLCVALTQHIVSSGGKKKNKSDNTWYSWTNNNKTHLKFDLTRQRYLDSKQDSIDYLNTFLDYRNELYNKKYKEYFSKKEYQFNGFAVA